ncbi:CopG family transcriptional regulator [Halorubrum sp. SD683]|uniref:ribbon-helix-helix domain-containing protein n=1 Tax=Halorubrum sp. SD683 TaxID=1855873 RepID=UPI000A2DA15E|nr:CopG family transcriptional regulator [Halorubrum sp. SD683]OTE99109.1 hypothetical protein B9G49_13375 [Halorubrum sp. SD683]
MERLTISIEDNQYAEIDAEAEERGVSKSQVVRERLRSGEDTVNSGEDAVNEPVNSGEDIVNLRDRVDELEQRVDELGGETPPTAQSDESDALSGSTGETMETPHRPDETAGSRPEPTPDSPSVGDDALEGAYQQWLEANGPRKPSVQEIVLDAFRFLRESGDAETSELRDHLHSSHPDAYGSPKSLWDSVGSRYVADAPGIEDGGYAHWEYAGDEAVAEELSEYL